MRGTVHAKCRDRPRNANTVLFANPKVNDFLFIYGLCGYAVKGKGKGKGKVKVKLQVKVK